MVAGAGTTATGIAVTSIGAGVTAIGAPLCALFGISHCRQSTSAKRNINFFIFRFSFLKYLDYVIRKYSNALG